MGQRRGVDYNTYRNRHREAMFQGDLPQTVIVYADGSCPENGKPFACGGWGILGLEPSGKLLWSNHGSELPGEPPVTNIRMELRAVIEALKMTSEDDVVELRSDSAYVINGILDKWYLNWFISGRNSTGARASNLDLWHELVDELARHVKVYPVHVRGHRGEEFQEQVDALAGRGSAEALIKFKEMAGNV